MGGHIALRWAAAHADDVASPWLLDAAGIWSAPKSELAETIEKTGVNPLNPADTDGFVRLYEFAMCDPPYVPAGCELPLSSCAVPKTVRSTS